MSGSAVVCAGQRLSGNGPSTFHPPTQGHDGGPALPASSGSRCAPPLSRSSAAQAVHGPKSPSGQLASPVWTGGALAASAAAARARPTSRSTCRRRSAIASSVRARAASSFACCAPRSTSCSPSPRSSSMPGRRGASGPPGALPLGLAPGSAWVVRHRATCRMATSYGRCASRPSAMARICSYSRFASSASAAAPWKAVPSGASFCSGKTGLAAATHRPFRTLGPPARGATVGLSSTARPRTFPPSIAASIA